MQKNNIFKFPDNSQYNKSDNTTFVEKTDKNSKIVFFNDNRVKISSLLECDKPDCSTMNNNTSNGVSSMQETDFVQMESEENGWKVIVEFPADPARENDLASIREFIKSVFQKQVMSYIA